MYAAMMATLFRAVRTGHEKPLQDPRQPRPNGRLRDGLGVAVQVHRVPVRRVPVLRLLPREYRLVDVDSLQRPRWQAFNE